MDLGQYGLFPDDRDLFLPERYAEAMNELSGPDATVYDVINQQTQLDLNPNLEQNPVY